MARNHAEAPRYFRAVIRYTSASGYVDTTVCGPYTARSSAKAQITLAESAAKASHGQYRDPANAFSAEGHIETAEVDWQRESAGE